MTVRVLFVDLENVQKLDLSKIPGDARVMVFYGVTQKKLPEELVVQAQPLGARLQWIKIAGQGPNALDFHVAFYLGRELTDHPKAQCTVLSHDTGFDPLIRHLDALGKTCSRVGSLKDAFPAEKIASPIVPASTGGSEIERLVKLLKKELVRPLKRKGLTGKVKSWFPGLAPEARVALVQQLFDKKHVRESGTSLTYHL